MTIHSRCNAVLKRCAMIGVALVTTTGCGPLQIWQHNGWTGGDAYRSQNDDTFVGNEFENGVNLNDAASSFRNDTASWAVIYEHSDYGGKVLCLEPGATVFAADQYKYTHNGLPRTFNDKASSVQFHEDRPAGGVCTWTVRGEG